VTRLLAAFSAAVVFATALSIHVRAGQFCEFHVSPVWIDVAVGGQTGSITIDAQPGCAWTASVQPNWVSIDEASGIGPGVIHYTAAAFPKVWDGSRLRQLRIRVRWNTPTLGQDVVLTQWDLPCQYTWFGPGNHPVSSVTFGALAGGGYFDVLADLPFSGAWSMATGTGVDWISMSPPSGIVGHGDGAAIFSVAANLSPEARSAIILACNGESFTIRQTGRTAATGHYVPGDFDGDGRADLAIFRPGSSSDPNATGRWFVLLSGSDYSYSGALSVDAGLHDGDPVIGDVDGDGRSDVVMAAAGSWAIHYSSDSYADRTATLNGLSGSPPREGIPQRTDHVFLAADFDGSGKPALSNYDAYNGTWSNWPQVGYRHWLPDTQWGRPSDVPVPGDYDGDGIADLAVWRMSEGRWYILYSSSGYSAASARSFQWGTAGDTPFAGDFDGDGRSDLAVFRPSNGTWYISLSSHGYDPAAAMGVQWGAPTDIPVVADYDGDGRMDLAVWRPSNGTWYLLFSSSRYDYRFARAIQWGNASYGDAPVGAKPVAVPLGVGGACPDGHPGQTVRCTFATSDANYPSSGGPDVIKVFADLSAFGLSSQYPVTIQPPCGADCNFYLSLFVPTETAPGLKAIPISAMDLQGRRADATIPITIRP
jgi:hypothetical protein